ncbi:hypothetical protein H632_c3444p0, partial [Helicosporidium sp. ATCC 50920]
AHRGAPVGGELRLARPRPGASRDRVGPDAGAGQAGEHRLRDVRPRRAPELPGGVRRRAHAAPGGGAPPRRGRGGGHSRAHQGPHGTGHAQAAGFVVPRAGRVRRDAQHGVRGRRGEDPQRRGQRRRAASHPDAALLRHAAPLGEADHAAVSQGGAHDGRPRGNLQGGGEQERAPHGAALPLEPGGGGDRRRDLRLCRAGPRHRLRRDQERRGRAGGGPAKLAPRARHPRRRRAEQARGQPQGLPRGQVQGAGGHGRGRARPRHQGRRAGGAVRAAQGGRDLHPPLRPHRPSPVHRRLRHPRLAVQGVDDPPAGARRGRAVRAHRSAPGRQHGRRGRGKGAKGRPSGQGRRGRLLLGRCARVSGARHARGRRPGRGQAHGALLGARCGGGSLHARCAGQPSHPRAGLPGGLCIGLRRGA